MKNFLLFLLSFGAFGALMAQNPPCQAFVVPTGWSSTGTVNLTAFDSSAFPVSSYLWNTGQTTEDIVVTDAGDYCVTITYEDGCTASDCYNLPDTCWVVVDWSWIDPDNLVAFAYPDYQGTSSYLWSTGQTTQSIPVPPPGTYCVTVTKADGCITTGCIDVGAPPPIPCVLHPWQTVDTSGTGVSLHVNLISQDSLTYLWDNGATSSSIYVTEPGTYCVTVTNGIDCTESHCFTVTCAVKVLQNATGLAAFPALGVPPYSYLWSNGATTQSIVLTSSGLYTVTVTDADGCTSTDYWHYQPYPTPCNASINYNGDNTLTAEMTGSGPFTYIWQPGGFTTQTIAPTAPGNYGVTVTDANGCQDWAYQNWYDPADCTVVVYQYGSDSTGGPAIVYFDLQGSLADWEVLWNTGETSASIQTTVAGQYCVTITNVFNGCMSSGCAWVQPDSVCTVQINGASIDPATWQLTAVGSPNPLTTYQWSTGETTPSIAVTASGGYQVTVTNNAGCTATGYTYVYPVNDWLIQVALSDSSGIGGAGVFADVYLIQYDTSQGGILTAIDTVSTTYSSSSWANVIIQDIPPGQYLVKAALKVGSEGYSNHLPTYRHEALLWSDATPLTVNALGGHYVNNTLYLKLVPGVNPGGPGFIGGLVSQGANIIGKGDEAENLGEGDPFPGAGIVLTLLDGTPVAATVTNSAGQYSFDDLAWGTYLITLDIPGLTPVSITVTIGPNHPAVTGANFKADEDSVALPTQQISAEQQMDVSPNPTKDVLVVALPAPAELTLTNVQGQIVLRTKETGQQVRLSLRHLPAGIYFLTALTRSGSQVVKVIKE